MNQHSFYIDGFDPKLFLIQKSFWFTICFYPKELSSTFNRDPFAHLLKLSLVYLLKPVDLMMFWFYFDAWNDSYAKKLQLLWSCIFILQSFLSLWRSVINWQNPFITPPDISNCISCLGWNLMIIIYSMIYLLFNQSIN